MLAVGGHLIKNLDERSVRMTTPFSGGVGGTFRDQCGAFSAGVMIIGALHGRTLPDHDEHLCLELATQFRDRFHQELGSVYCHELRAEKFGSGGEQPCWVLVERASRLLLQVLQGG